ncbi:MAG: hypothetical protein REI94_01060 [Moraxellaceae bacterium]|nr:hypothetical protein [Moraxellaceae bacterium]
MNSVSPRIADYADTSQCLALIQALNPTDLDDTQAAIGGVLEGMLARPPEPAGHLQVLEQIRPTLDFVQSQAAQRYASRPLPPASGEEDTLQRVVRLWELMQHNYAQVTQRSALDPGFNERRALIAQRRLQYHALSMMEFFRARREMQPGMWHTLHQVYLSAERAGAADVRVADPLNEVWGAQSANECYVAMLLIDAASPYSRTPREFAWLARWAQRFAPYCVLLKEIEPGKGSQYALDLEGDHGLRPVGTLLPGAQARGLNTKKLASHIHAVVSQLKKGVAAASLGLGDDCVQPACARLLVSLYRPWGLASAGRKFPRRSLRGQVQIATDPMAVAFFLEGREFTQPFDARRSNFSETMVMRTFGERAEQTDTELLHRAMQLGFVQEAWDVADQSVAGYRLTRQQGDSRIEHRQLIGLRATSNDKMLLAEVSWLQYQQAGALYAGVSLMPGPPQVAAVRLHLNERSARDRYRLGFIIPGVPALKTDATLILPAGWFLAGRRVEVYTEQGWFARLVKLVARGSNFDRVSFSREE